MRIPVVFGQTLHSGVRIVTGSMPVSLLAEVFVVPYREPLKKKGYQRKPQDARINRFANELAKGQTDVPTSILLNIRENADSLVREDENGAFFLDFSLRPLTETELYVVDGQHRILAFKKLHEENQEKWASHCLQFVLMLGAQEREEVNQFYIVNTTAKSVKTDLAFDLLKQRADADGQVMSDAVEKGIDWKISAQEIVDDLYANSPVWKGKIQLANQSRGEAVIPAASFVTSLKSLLTNSPVFKKVSPEKRVNIVNSYWSGIREALREPFDDDPNHYALQKGIGVTAMHEILPTVIEIVRSNGDSVFDPSAYRGVMEPVLQELGGDNVEGANVTGADFWLTAPRGGAAGSYSSSAGKRVLFAKLRALLPEIDVE